MNRLVVTNRMLNNARKDRAAGTIEIDPKKFLELTIPKDFTVTTFISSADAKPLGDYNAGALAGKSETMPFLKVNYDTGKVMDHDGRHRAVALAKISPTPMRIAVYFVNSAGVIVLPTEVEPESIPTEWTHQFSQKAVTVETEIGAIFLFADKTVAPLVQNDVATEEATLTTQTTALVSAVLAAVVELGLVSSGFTPTSKEIPYGVAVYTGTQRGHIILLPRVASVGVETKRWVVNTILQYGVNIGMKLTPSAVVNAFNKSMASAAKSASLPTPV